MKKELKITLLNHLKNLKWLFFMTIGYYVVLYILTQDLSIFTSKDFYFIHIWVIWQLAVVIYIHLSYFRENVNCNYFIEKNHIIDNTTDKKYYNNEIKKIIIHKSNILRKGRATYFPFQYYKYCEIILINGDKLILTSLLDYNIDEYLKENLKGVLFENDDSSFCYFL